MMAITQMRDSDIISDVIVRAFGGEPVRLKARSQIKNAIEVIGDDPNMPAYFPASAVYKFDDGLFRKLRAAYERRETGRLDELWNKANAYTSTESRSKAS